MYSYSNSFQLFLSWTRSGKTLKSNLLNNNFFKCLKDVLHFYYSFITDMLVCSVFVNQYSCYSSNYANAVQNANILSIIRYKHLPHSRLLTLSDVCKKTLNS